MEISLKTRFRKAMGGLACLAAAAALSACGGSDPAGWSVLRGAHDLPLGYEHEGNGLYARYDLDSRTVDISPSAPEHQPTMSGVWEGRWGGTTVENFHSDSPMAGEFISGPAEINVTLDGTDATASVTYRDVPAGPALRDVSSDDMAIVDGAFAGVTSAGPQGGYTFRGQFGGEGQSGVVGYVHNIGSPLGAIVTTFRGDRQ